MKTTRRNFLKGVGVAGAVAAVPVSLMLREPSQPTWASLIAKLEAFKGKERDKHGSALTKEEVILFGGYMCKSSDLTKIYHSWCALQYDVPLLRWGPPHN